MPNTVSAMAHPPSIRPRVRARRGQATDPHSIAERVRCIVCESEMFIRLSQMLGTSAGK